MKKLFCMLLALGMVAVGAACGEETPNEDNKNNSTPVYDEIKGERVTKEQWDAAWQLFKTADNATAFLDGLFIEDGHYEYGTGTIKIADGKIFEYFEAVSSVKENPEEDPDAEYWENENRIGKVDGTLYKWVKYDDDEDWGNAYPIYDYSGDITLGCDLVLDRLELFMDYEAMSYLKAEYSAEKSAYLLTVVDSYPDGRIKVKIYYEIKIVNGKISNMEVELECYYGSSIVMETGKISYAFTYSGVSLGELPPLKLE